MEYVNGAALRGSHRAVLDALRPYIRILRVSGFEEETVRCAFDQACRLCRRSPARRLSLHRTGELGLDQARILELMSVLRVWSRDPDFVDGRGQPRRLSLDGGAGSFRALLRRANASGASRTLVQLQAFGSIRRCDQGRRVRLVSAVLVPAKGRRFVVAPIMESIRWFGETLEHELCESSRPGEERLHRWVFRDSLDPARLEEIQRYTRSSGQNFLEALEDKLSACVRPRARPGARSGAGPGSRSRGLSCGVGLYVFLDGPKAARRRGTKARRRSRR